MQNKFYYFLKVQCPKINEREALTANILENFPCSGVEDFNLDEPSVDEILGERAYSGGDVPETVLDEVADRTESDQKALIKFYLDIEDESSIASSLERIKEDFPMITIELVKEEISDWDAQWRKHYQRIDVSDKLSVVPEWEKGENNLQNEVYIYPGQGFGTGGHETTFLCLNLFLQLDNISIGELCLDFGCGSGILGIAAIKLAGMKVDFCDIDRPALENTLQNIQLNLSEAQMNGHRLVLRDRFSPEGPYSIVFANILKPVLISEKATIVSELKADGHLILSGLLHEHVNDVLEAYSDFELVKHEKKNDWSALLMKRRA